MLTINYPQLTSEQINLIPQYRHKWQQIALNNEPIDRERAKLAINNAYSFLNLSEPNLIFFSTPDNALEYIDREVIDSWGKLKDTCLGSSVAGDLVTKLLANTRSQIKGKILDELQGNLDEGLAYNIALNICDRFPENQIFSIVLANFRSMAVSQSSEIDDHSLFLFNLFLDAGFVFNQYISFPLWQVQKQISSFFTSDVQSDRNINRSFTMLFSGANYRHSSGKYQLPIVEASSRFANVIVPSEMVDYAYYIDYCHEVLNCDRDALKWKIFSNLITNCGWIFPYQKTVLVCGA